MFSPTGSRDPVFECASPSNPLQSRRSAAAEAQRLPQEEHTWTAGDWVVGRNAKAEFALTNDDLASIDVRRVGGGRLDIRRPKKYYSRPDLHRLSEQKHGTHGIAAWSKCPLGSARGRLPRLLRAHLVALAGPMDAQSLPRVIELAASKVAHFPAFDHSGIAKHGITKTTLTSPLRMTRSRAGKSACQSPGGKSPRKSVKQSHV